MNAGRYWAPLSAAALSVSLFHTLVDWHIGLFGATSQSFSAPQAAFAWVTAALYGWWGWSLAGAASGGRGHMTSLVVFALGWGFAGNGLVILACLPPCAGGFPHQDIAHVGSLIVGAVASYAAWRSLQEQAGSIERRHPAIATGLVVAVFALEGIVTLVP